MNNLRDDESVYMGRGSFYSEYEASDEGMKVFFKEHGRSGSSGSASSFLSPSNPQVGKQSQGSGVRPETQVSSTLPAYAPSHISQGLYDPICSDRAAH